jgi:hypothetical protein
MIPTRSIDLITLITCQRSLSLFNERQSVCKLYYAENSHE